jgi:spore maturation protein SpmB
VSGTPEPRWLLPMLRALAAFGTAAMLTTIIAAFGVASFADDGATLVALAWGRVTLIDLYLALLLGWVWIAWRERSAIRAVLWALVIVVTGSLGLFLYLLVASLRAHTPLELLVGARGATVER